MNTGSYPDFITLMYKDNYPFFCSFTSVTLVFLHTLISVGHFLIESLFHGASSFQPSLFMVTSDKLPHRPFVFSTGGVFSLCFWRLLCCVLYCFFLVSWIQGKVWWWGELLIWEEFLEILSSILGFLILFFF